MKHTSDPKATRSCGASPSPSPHPFPSSPLHTLTCREREGGWRERGRRGTDRETVREGDRETERDRERQRQRETDKQTDRQRQTDRQTETERGGGSEGGRDCLFVGWLTSQQHASVSQGRICSDNFTCCHTEIQVADQTFYLTQSQYTDTGPTSPSADPITPGAWQGSHWSANV